MCHLKIKNDSLKAISTFMWLGEKLYGLKKYATGIETISKYLNYAEWNENCINERADNLASKAIKVWCFQ